jgi:glycosyltransferase involved in cell wall biosynthesis
VISVKILLVQDCDWQKKGPHQQHHLMELMSIRGHEIVVIGFDQLWKEEKFSVISKRIDNNSVNRFYSGASIHYIRPSFVKIPVLDYISLTISSFFEIRKQIKKFQPDIVIGFSGVLTNYLGIKLAKKFRLPYLYYCFDNPSMVNVPKPFVSLAETIVIDIMKQSDKVLTINETLNDYIITLGVDPKTTEVLLQGVDFKRFKISETKRMIMRTNYKIGETDFLLFFMGWLYTFSGLIEVILDMYKYRDLYPHIKLMIVGFGDDYRRLKDLTESLNIGDRVIMTGEKPYAEIPELLSAADVCLLPAHNDDIIRDIVPIKMYEYLAMYKPIIASKLPGIYKEFGENNGVLYVENSTQVIDKVISLTNEQILLNQEYAKSFIKNYGWETIILKFEKILESMH